jgi:hypothetical protein
MHLVPFVPSEFSRSRSVREDVFSLRNLFHDGRNRSNVVIESRDEILFKGCRL